MSSNRRDPGSPGFESLSQGALEDLSRRRQAQGFVLKCPTLRNLVARDLFACVRREFRGGHGDGSQTAWGRRFAVLKYLYSLYDFTKGLPGQGLGTDRRGGK